MGIANDDFVTKMTRVFAGRRTILPNTHASATINHSTLLTEMDTHWVAMTAGEKQECAMLFNSATESGARVRVASGLTWPKHVFISPAEAADLKIRYAP